ncbi:nitrilase-related carbon-nitrogen hydrolase [Oceaniglobus indicus]|uniref:nitrilase-related carbon-nitrogen hydrolase n=1 Tax=Oceaniglobus indicus TaxID=2047749 RepID=UPI000C18E7B1|nr:nitrilase-related carbon-nitrogen hydrolase [Oceaniglobus indicus]
MKLAVWQTEPHNGPDAALTALDAAARDAAGADVLLAPEMAIGGYAIAPGLIRHHAGMADGLIARIAEICTRHDIAIVCGLALPGHPLPLNGAVAIDRTGRELSRYAKTHLFGPTDNGRFMPGETISPVFDLAGWKVALAICYDIEFPELAQALAQRGADLLLVPTANMVPFDSVAQRMVPTRAEENAVCIAYANLAGVEGEVTYGGLSCICGADGDDLARAGHDRSETITATLSRDGLDRARTLQTHRTDRRPELFT